MNNFELNQESQRSHYHPETQQPLNRMDTNLRRNYKQKIIDFTKVKYHSYL